MQVGLAYKRLFQDINYPTFQKVLQRLLRGPGMPHCFLPMLQRLRKQTTSLTRAGGVEFDGEGDYLLATQDLAPQDTVHFSREEYPSAGIKQNAVANKNSCLILYLRSKREAGLCGRSEHVTSPRSLKVPQAPTSTNRRQLR
jgi:hypothetical protein